MRLKIDVFQKYKPSIGKKSQKLGEIRNELDSKKQKAGVYFKGLVAREFE
jgi:hypothetical protein